MSENTNREVRIRVPREEARAKLQKQIDEGDYLNVRDIGTPTDLKVAWDEYRRWHEYIEDLLLRLFATDKMYQEFVKLPARLKINPTFEQNREQFHDNLSMELNKLRSIMNRLELFEEDIATTSVAPSKNVEVRTSKEVVFVVHGRNEKLRDAMFDFLRAVDLNPREWPQLKAEAMKETKQGLPYVGAIVDTAFKQAQGIVVLLSGDDVARLREEFLRDGDPDYERELTPQARPNVLFEGGMAMGICPEKTIWVQVGQVRPFSDTVGRHVIHLDNSHEKRHQLIQELKAIQCKVDDSGTRWMEVGDFIDEPDSKKRDINWQESTSVLKESSTEGRTVLLTQARHLKKRIQQALEDGDSTLAPDFAVELDRLLLPACFACGYRQEILSIKLEFQALSTAKLNDKLALLKSTLNSVERLVLIMEELA